MPLSVVAHRKAAKRKKLYSRNYITGRKEKQMYFPERRIEPPEYTETPIYCPVCGEEEPEELRLIPTVSFAYLFDDIVGCEKCMPKIEDDDVISIDDRYEIYRLLGGCD